MARVAYDFSSVWRSPGDPDASWRAILAIGTAAGAAAWPGVRIGLPGEPRVGDVVPIDVRSGLGYRLRAAGRLTEVVPGVRLAAAATGDLDGTGEVTIEAAGGPDGIRSLVRIRWRVRTGPGWMNALAGPLGPLFRGAHDRVMARGERALADEVRRLQAD